MKLGYYLPICIFFYNCVPFTIIHSSIVIIAILNVGFAARRWKWRCTDACEIAKYNSLMDYLLRRNKLFFSHVEFDSQWISCYGIIPGLFFVISIFLINDFLNL